jgi:hypothetical protein
MSATSSGYHAKRPLTAEEIQRVVDAINGATTSAELIHAAVRTIFTALLSGTGGRWEDFSAEQRLNPTDYAIPKSQLDALLGVITSRADQWGTSVQLALHLINVLPSWYDDPTIPAPVIAAQDRRPYLHDIHISREAVDVIATCEHHLGRLGSYYGWESGTYRTALASWHRHLAGLFAMRSGADTRVAVEGRLSLFVSTDSGYVYAIIWHGVSRRCTVDGCRATISDDGTAQTATAGANPAPEHQHQPSYPLDAPQPGEWTAHS